MTSLAVILDQVVPVQRTGSGVNEIFPALLQEGVFARLVVRNAVQSGVPQHADVQVRVAWRTNANSQCTGMCSLGDRQCTGMCSLGDEHKVQVYRYVHSPWGVHKQSVYKYV